MNTSHDWRLVGVTDGAPGEKTARYRCHDCKATVDLPPIVNGSIYAIACWMDKQAGPCMHTQERSDPGGGHDAQDDEAQRTT